MNLQVVQPSHDPSLAHLQPGLYVAGIVDHLAGRGHAVKVVKAPAGRPDALVWCLGPSSFLRARPARVRASARRIVAFVPGPLYTTGQLRKNLGSLLWRTPLDNAAHVAAASLGLAGFAKRLAACVDAVVVPTRTLRGQLVAAGLPDSMVHHVAQGLDPVRTTEQGDEAAARLLAVLRLDTPFVVNFGPIRPVRGVDTLVAAAPRLSGDLRILVLARTGDGRPARDLAWLRRRIERAGATADVVVHQASLDRATLLGVVRRARAAAFPLRLVQSIQPVAVHETFQVGVPTALSDVAPLGELADGPQAQLFPVGNEEGLANALLELDRNRTAAAQACAEWTARQHTWPEIAARMEGLLE